MKRCAVCGMAEEKNEAHGSDYSGTGKHSFKLSAQPTKSFLDDENLDDIIVSWGGEVKSIDITTDGKGGFEGYLAVFSDATDTDLVGDYFTKSTEFYVEDGAIIPILYDHGLNATIKGKKIGRATIKYDDVGLFIKGELDLRNKYVKAVHEKLVKKGKAGLSSGAARHMTQRKSVRKGVNEILAWGIAEGSITVAPTEPKCEAMALKSYLDERVDPFEEDDEFKAAMFGAKKAHKFVPTDDDDEKCADCGGKIDNVLHGKMTKSVEEEEEELVEIVQRPLKGLFEEKLAEKTPSIWEIRQVRDDVIKDIASAALTTEISGVEIDVESKVTEAVTECAAREIPLIVKQVKDWVDKGGTDRDGSRYFYLRSLPPSSLSSIGEDLGTGLQFNEHSTQVVTALEEFVGLVKSIDAVLTAYTGRVEERIEFRASSQPLKSRRVLSEQTLQKLVALKGHLAPLVETLVASQGRIDNLIEKATPAEEKKGVDPATLLQLQYDLTRHQTETALMTEPWPSA